MTLQTRWLLCFLGTTLACAPTGANLGSNTASSTERSAASLNAYELQFDVSQADAAVLLDWYKSQSSGDSASSNYTVAEATKTQVAARLYQQAKDKGLYQGPNPSQHAQFDWACLQVRFKNETSTSGTQAEKQTLSHIFAHKPGEHGCYDEVFSAVLAKQGATWIAYEPKSFVFDQAKADSTAACTEHVHYTVGREPHGLRCNGTDTFKITIYDKRRCDAETLTNRFAPPPPDFDALQFTNCGGAVRISEPAR